MKINLNILGVLGLIFVTLKLVGTITWSWWWVLFPFYGPVALWLAILFGVFILAAIGASK